MIKGGEVVDRASGLEGPLDVAIHRGRIAAVEREIPAESAREVIDAGGRYVTPGLVDAHTHVYRGVTWWGIDPDPVAWRTGVTTWIDAGSAGAFTLPGFREFVAAPAAVRVFALMNITAIGLVAETRELRDLVNCDVDLCERLVDLNRDLVLGVKARIERRTVGDNGLEPLRRAREVAERTELPLMVHISYAPPEIDEVVALMRPGDVLTHCATGHSMRIVDERGEPFPFVRRAWESGLVLDVGHGAGSFSWQTTEALLAAGMAPDVISSDIHQLSVHGPMFDLPTCISKFLALGVSLPDAVEAATARPAAAFGLGSETGTLRPGARADVALFELERGRFPLYDVHLEMREADVLLRNTLTLVGGRALEPKLPAPPAPWIPLTGAQRAVDEAARHGSGEQPARLLTNPGDLPVPVPLELEDDEPGAGGSPARSAGTRG